MSRKAWEKALGYAGAGGSRFGARGSKYAAIRTTTPDGEVFDSRGESRRWAVLKQAEMAGLIVKGSLQRQVRFPLEVNGVKVCDYVADFVYTLGGELARDAGDANLKVVEDFKGTVTDVAKLKMRLFEAVHGFPVLVTKSPGDALGAVTYENGITARWKPAKKAP